MKKLEYRYASPETLVSNLRDFYTYIEKETGGILAADSLWISKELEEKLQTNGFFIEAKVCLKLPKNTAIAFNSQIFQGNILSVLSGDESAPYLRVVVGEFLEEKTDYIYRFGH